MQLYDITIVGGGPVGLFAILCSPTAKPKSKLSTLFHNWVGQPAILYPEKQNS